MSRRRSDRHARTPARPPQPLVPAKAEPGPPAPSLREQLATATVPAAALLPLRIFLGVTFLYAGLDKLLDPAFFDASNAASIQGQLAAFTRTSPLGELVKLVEPLAVPMGLTIAIAEIGIGIGTLSGLAFRVAAAGGAALSLLFWLTASWATRPYYYGPDLPYAAGWIALALAGTGGLLVPSQLRPAIAAAGRRPAPVGRWQEPDGPPLERRLVLQTGLLAIGAVAVASLAVPLRVFGFELSTRPVASFGPAASGSPAASGHPSATGTPSASGSPAPAGSPSAVASSSAAGVPVATIAAVQKAGTASFTIPFDAPAPLPGGDPGIIIKLKDGTFVAYDAVCTHEGCTVEWDAPDNVIFCPCHGAVFDAANDAAVLAGPTNQPLMSLPLVIDQASGQIYLKT